MEIIQAIMDTTEKKYRFLCKEMGKTEYSRLGLKPKFGEGR